MTSGAHWNVSEMVAHEVYGQVLGAYVPPWEWADNVVLEKWNPPLEQVKL